MKVVRPLIKTDFLRYDFIIIKQRYTDIDTRPKINRIASSLLACPKNIALTFQTALSKNHVLFEHVNFSASIVICESQQKYKINRPWLS